ncbi:MAG: PQQ-binding-like beta-propeller repeat protein [Terracidiphilus sp.]
MNAGLRGTARVGVVFLTIAWPLICSAQSTVGWPVFNGGPDADHYSRLTQINRGNVGQLKLAWSFDTGEKGGNPDGPKGGIQDNPLIVGDTLYAYTPTEKVVALEAATGKLKWTFDSGVAGRQPVRGVTYWTDGKEKRIFAGVMNFLYCLDAGTGQPVATFGENGHVDLRKGLREGLHEDYQKQSIALTTPGIVYKDLIIVGGRNPESHPAPPGDIRAFDVRTGKLQWTFHTIPRPGEPGYETWPPDAWQTAGAANNWAGMSLDVEHGIVFVPTGSAVMDFYGGDRVGNDLYANTLLALDANTGKLLWHFQGVHHDIWDRDFPAQPALFTLKKNGKTIDALAQITKQSYIYEFDRLTGKPLFPIHEHPYPPSTVPGEVASPTQPMPDWPAPFGRQRVTEDMLTNRTPEAHAWAVKQFQTFRSDGQFVPFSVGKPTIIFPGYDGGGEWSGAAINPATHVLYVGSTEMAWTGELAPVARNASAGAQIYESQCAMCHGVDRAGSPPAFPSLVGILDRQTPQQVTDQVKNGKGRMPSFPNLDDHALEGLLRFLEVGDKVGPQAPEAMERVGPYVFTGYRKFLDPDGYPAITPPWGTLNAIDLATGKYLWKIPLGEYPDLVKQGIRNTGSELYGGPIVTAGGLVFIGATVFDRKFRAFDSATGKLLWETELPFAGLATPATYMVDGRQYVVIAASGGRDPKSPVGGAYIAFALPR